MTINETQWGNTPGENSSWLYQKDAYVVTLLLKYYNIDDSHVCNNDWYIFQKRLFT